MSATDKLLTWETAWTLLVLVTLTQAAFSYTSRYFEKTKLFKGNIGFYAVFVAWAFTFIAGAFALKPTKMYDWVSLLCLSMFQAWIIAMASKAQADKSADEASRRRVPQEPIDPGG